MAEGPEPPTLEASLAVCEVSKDTPGLEGSPVALLWLCPTDQTYLLSSPANLKSSNMETAECREIS